MSSKDKKQQEKEAQATNGGLNEGLEIPVEEDAQEVSEETEGALAQETEADEMEAAEEEAPETLEEQLTRERDEFQEKWLREVAEPDTLRKRSSKQLLDGRRYAQAEALRPFLEVHDNF